MARNSTNPIYRNSFRKRGFSFLNKAGNFRGEMNLAYMWQTRQDWMRMTQSYVIQKLPQLGPKPLGITRNHEYAPPVKDPESFSFIIAGDTGTNSPAQYLVSTAISRQDIYPSEFCMLLGDVIYPTGGEESYQYGLFEAFKHYDKPILALPGNHDWYDSLKAYRKFFVQDASKHPLAAKYGWQSPQLPNWYYFMDFGDKLRVICLDTGLSGKMEQNRKAQLQWLDHLLETAGDRKVIVMMHHPLYSLKHRSHEKRLRQLIEKRLDKANVVAVFTGHDHNYQRHTVNGRQHVIQGAGGAALHKLPEQRLVDTADGKTQRLTRKALWDQRFSFIHCRYENGQLTCTTFSAHELPGLILDQFVV